MPYLCMCVLSRCSNVQIFATRWTTVHQAPLCSWDFPGENTGVGCLFLLQGIFRTQGSNSCLLYLPHQQVGSLPLVLPGKPLIYSHINREHLDLFFLGRKELTPRVHSHICKSAKLRHTVHPLEVLIGKEVPALRNCTQYRIEWASLVAQMVKNSPAIHTGDLGLIPGLGRYPGGEYSPLAFGGGS